MKTNNKDWIGKAGISPINQKQSRCGKPYYTPIDAPPIQIPFDLIDEYTLDGKVKLRWWYCNAETNVSEFEEGVKYMGESLKKLKNYFRKDDIDEKIKQAKNKQLGYYGDVVNYIHEAFEKFPIKDKTIAVMGSTHPVCESICLAYGAKPVTIEYKEIECDDERIKTYTVDEFYKNPVLCDFGISISSFEHDGLGCYGDPLDPQGDLKAMKRMKHTIKKGGLLFLAIPIGEDRIDWNAHRVYGPVRLPMMLDGWERIADIGFDESMFEIEPGHPMEENIDYGSKHSLFILRNT